MDISHLAGTIEQIRQLNDAINKLEERRDALKADIIEALGEAEAGAVDGTVVVTYRSQTRSTFDVKKFRDQNPKLAESYTRTSVTRSFRFVDSDAS